MKLSKKINKFNLGGPMLDGIYVSYPNQSIKIGPKRADYVGGHGMVIAVDENTGTTRGSEYGRYNGNNSSTYGNARRVNVPDFHPADPGNPTKEELDAYAKKLQKDAYGPKVNVTYVKGADYDKMVDYMKKSERNNKKDGYSNKPYNLYNHNCGTYGVETINQAMPWYRQITGKAINSLKVPSNAILGGLMGIGHDIEQKGHGENTWKGFTNFSGAGGRADMHGFSLPWGTTRGSYTKK